MTNTERIPMKRLRKLGLALVCLGVFQGCGKGNGHLNVVGRIVKNGAVLTVPEWNTSRVTFFPVTTDNRPPKNTYIAEFDGANGPFRAVGGDGTGIPPGRYRVALENFQKRKDLFNGAYDGDRSPYVFEVD